jgi:hypothetical protein
MPLYDSVRDGRAANLAISSADDDLPAVHQLVKLQYLSGICGIVIGFVALLATGSSPTLTTASRRSVSTDGSCRCQGTRFLVRPTGR